MKKAIISYSLTGNNEVLATSLAAALDAEHLRITEPRHRTMLTIMLDMILGRTPPVEFPPLETEKYDLVLFVGPIWMGQIATPLRGCFEQLRSIIGKYIFISISGGADGPNPKIAAELERRLKNKPITIIDLHIADLLPSEPKPRRSDTSTYRINGKDTRGLTEKAVTILKRVISDKKDF
jgi:flavodoxin